MIKPETYIQSNFKFCKQVLVLCFSVAFLSVPAYALTSERMLELSQKHQWATLATWLAESLSRNPQDIQVRRELFHLQMILDNTAAQQALIRQTQYQLMQEEAALRLKAEASIGMISGWNPTNHAQGLTQQLNQLIGQMRRMNPQSASLLYTKGYLALNQGNLRAAESLFSQALLIDPQDFRTLQALLYVDLQTRNLGGATPLLTQLMELVPDDPDTLYLAGLFYQAKNQPDKALTALEQSRVGDPKPRPARLFALANTYAKLGQSQQAAICYQQVLAFWPQRGDIWQTYGDILKAAGQQAEAIAAYKKAYQYKPDSLDGLWAAAEPDFWSQHLTSVLPQYALIAQITDNEPRVLALLASIHYRLWETFQPDDDNTLQSLATKIAAASKTNPSPALNIAAISLQLAIQKGWSPELKQAVETELVQNRSDAYSKALLLTIQGDVLDAKAQWQTLAATQLTAGQAQRAVLMGLGSLIQPAQLTDTSVAGVSQWVDTDNETGKNALQKADLLIAANLLAEAQKAMTQAHRLNPFSAAVPLRLAQIALKQQDTPHAQQFISLARQLGPNAQQAAMADELTLAISGIASGPGGSQPSKHKRFFWQH